MLVTQHVGKMLKNNRKNILLFKFTHNIIILLYQQVMIQRFAQIIDSQNISTRKGS